MDLYQTALICFTLLAGVGILSGALVLCFRVYVRYEERSNIREQETATHKARMYAEKDISKSYLENMANSFGMYPPGFEEIPQNGTEALLSFIATPEGQALLSKLGINPNHSNTEQK